MEAVRQRRVDGDRAAGDGASVGGLVNRLLQDLLRLLDQKFALLKLELREELTAAVRRTGLLVAGGVVAVLGVFFLVVALAIWISDLLGSPPAGFAIVGGALAIGGGLLLLGMRRQLAEQQFVPRETVQELRRDASWIKHEL